MHRRKVHLDKPFDPPCATSLTIRILIVLPVPKGCLWDTRIHQVVPGYPEEVSGDAASQPKMSRWRLLSLYVQYMDGIGFWIEHSVQSNFLSDKLARQVLIIQVVDIFSGNQHELTA